MAVGKTALLALWLATTLTLLGVNGASETNDGESPQKVIAGYLPEYRSYINVNATASILTDLILFSVEPKRDGSVMGGCCCLRKNHFELARKAAHGSPVRLWITVGGGGRSQHFRSIVRDPASRKKMMTQLEKLCKREGVDGVDFDWEVPRTQDDLKMYYRLIKETSQHFKDLKVSVALHVGMYLPPRLYAHVDRIHLMTYDIPGVGYHADATTVQKMAQSFLERGCPPEKLVLGLPLYARHAQNPGDVKTISEIMDATNNNHDVVLQSSLGFQGYQFESPNHLKAKLEFVKKEGLGGIFFWEIGQDKQDDKYPGGVLMTTATHQLDELQEEPTLLENDEL